MKHSFSKKKHISNYDKENFQPIIKASICTGEQVAGFRNKKTGKLEEVMLIRSNKDLDLFMEQYNIDIVNIKKEY